MIQGTTPTHTFRLPIDTETIKTLRITYNQFGKNILEKTETDVEMSGNTIHLTLTQQEAFAFNWRAMAKFQVTIKTFSGAVLKSNIKEFLVYESFNKEVFT